MTDKKLLFYLFIISSLIGSVDAHAQPQAQTTKITPVKSYTEINSLNEFQQAINSNKPTVLLFYAPWCSACTSIKPLFEAEALRYKDKVQFVAIDATKEHLKDPVDMFGIQGIPTLVYKQVGLKTKDEFSSVLTSLYGPPAQQTKLIVAQKKGIIQSPTRTAKKPASTTKKSVATKKPVVAAKKPVIAKKPIRT